MVIQPYGPTSYAAEESYGGYVHFHQGIDYALPARTPLFAAGDGTVCTDYTHGYGLHVTIDHGADSQGRHVMSLCGHMSQSSVSVGQTVKQGDPIGLSGGGTGNPALDGNSSGWHLHFAIYLNGAAPADPADYLSGKTHFTSDNSGGSGGSGGGSPALPANATTVTPEQAVYYARAAGIPEDQLATCVAIAMAESSLLIAATNQNTNGSTDRGLWQINSVHTEYDPNRLLTDPAYNAQAMAAIYNARLKATGQRWTDWSTFNNGAYLTHLALAQQAVKNLKQGQLPAGLNAGAGSSSGAGSSGLPSIPVDTTPQQPVTQYRLQPAGVAPGRLAPPSRGIYSPTCVLWVAGGHWLPVRAATVTRTQQLVAGKLSAELSIPDVVERIGEDALESFLSSGVTQALVAMGYAPAGSGAPLDPRRLTQMITGLVDQPAPSYQGPDESLSLSGPDLSGIFSDPSATTSQFQQFQNKRSDEVVIKLVQAHNPPGAAGLTVKAAKGSATLGGLFGGDFVQTRQQGTVEWDVITSLAAGEGYVAYFNGTELYYGPPVTPGPPLVLGYRVKGQPAGPVVAVTPQIAPHNKRSYKVVVASWNTKKGQPTTAEAGNHDATTVAQIPAATNLSQAQVQRLADAAAQSYAAAERTLTLELAHPVPLAEGQPIILMSDRPGLRQFTGMANPFYPTTIEYHYTANPIGLTMHIEASCLPPALEGRTTSGANLLGNLGDLGLSATIGS